MRHILDHLGFHSTSVLSERISNASDGSHKTMVVQKIDPCISKSNFFFKNGVWLQLSKIIS
jgi:hypothetical protein